MSTISPTDSRTILGDRTDKPPFKLCFSKQQQIGRSDACVSKINADVVTPKFYSREIETLQQLDVNDTVQQLTKQERKTPKEVYRWPLLTSHAYGWWHEKGIQPKDSRFHFHKKTSDLVSFQMKIYAEDKKTKGTNPRTVFRGPILRESYSNEKFYDKRKRSSKDRINGE